MLHAMPEDFEAFTSYTLATSGNNCGMLAWATSGPPASPDWPGARDEWGQPSEYFGHIWIVIECNEEDGLWHIDVEIALSRRWPDGSTSIYTYFDNSTYASGTCPVGEQIPLEGGPTIEIVS